MGYPANAEVISGIAKGAFFTTLQMEQANRIYPKITYPITQDDLTVTYASWGAVPEPRQLTATTTTPGSASGSRQMKELKDFKLAVTVVEWEDTVEMPRAIAESYPDQVALKVSQMAMKAQLFMDRQLCTVLEAATAGYDGAALFSTTHNESGSNQSNTTTTAVTGGATGTTPSSSELENMLSLQLAKVRSFTDDAGTPVNDGVTDFYMLVPTDMDYLTKAVVNPQINIGAIPFTDVSGGKGAFRGRMEVLTSAFVLNNGSADRYYIFAKRPGTGAVGLAKNKDWEFKTNVGTDSDLWNFGQKAIFYGYARWLMIPWDWKYAHRQIMT